jgi:hypothetical protein
MSRRTLAILFFAFLLSFPLFGATITSVSPDSGPAAGGTQVTIRGTGFTNCVICSPPVPPRVFFGGLEATSVTYYDETLVVATTPAHFPGPVAVQMIFYDLTSTTLPAAFRYVGDPATSGYERILVPLLSPPIHGANGSEFHTDLRLINRSSQRMTVFGLQDTDGENTIPAGGELEPSDIVANGAPGRFLYIADSLSDDLWSHLRAYDTSRSAENFGTEIPIVSEAEFVSGPEVVLGGVPTDPRFRNTLRIYSTEAMDVTVTWSGPGVPAGIVPIDVPVHLQAGANEFIPAYAMFTGFPVSQGIIRVGILVPEGAPKIWPMITVTNNDTQLMTTITP